MNEEFYVGEVFSSDLQCLKSCSSPLLLFTFFFFFSVKTLVFLNFLKYFIYLFYRARECREEGQKEKKILGGFHAECRA